MCIQKNWTILLGHTVLCSPVPRSNTDFFFPFALTYPCANYVWKQKDLFIDQQEADVKVVAQENKRLERKQT